MRNLKYPEILNTVLSMICSAIPPVLITVFVENKGLSLLWEVLIKFLAYIIASASFIILHKCLPIWIPLFRPLRKYEGKWLQFIPDSKERPFSVITFSFRRDLYGYYLFGTNFSPNGEKTVFFDANKFVETSAKNGFYYITNTTSEYKNGLGKISFIDSSYDHLLRANGYFFDSGRETCSEKYRTFFIKCDKNFFRSLGAQYSNIKIKELKHNDIFALCSEFAKNELERISNAYSFKKQIRTFKKIRIKRNITNYGRNNR